VSAAIRDWARRSGYKIGGRGRIPGVEYVFHHPLIRTVAYEAQLKSDRASCTGAWLLRSNPATRQPPMRTRR